MDIQQRIENSVTNGRGYHDPQDKPILGKKSITKAELKAYLLSMDLRTRYKTLTHENAFLLGFEAHAFQELRLDPAFCTSIIARTIGDLLYDAPHNAAEHYCKGFHAAETYTKLERLANIVGPQNSNHARLLN